MALITEKLTVRLQRRTVLHQISLSLGGGQVVGLIGPNGAGKSTLMRALAGIVPDRKSLEGNILWGAERLSAMNPQMRARRVAFMPQERRIAWPMSVRNLVALGRLPQPGGGNALARCYEPEVERALDLMDCRNLADRDVTRLSGGEQARALAARAVAQATPILILDEPASGLDPAHQIRMMMALKELAGQGVLVLVSLHELNLAAHWCDRVVLMQEGSLVAEGLPDDVLTVERLRQAYGVETEISNTDGNGLDILIRGLSVQEGLA